MATAALAGILEQLRTMVHAKAYEESSDRQLLELFLAQREEAAFVALLKRHGPMVLQVCHRIQGNQHDAEDVFQATFLLLARKAGSIRKPESLASWLHGVAHRLALEAKAQRTRRQAYERQAAEMRSTSSVSVETWQELQETLDEALRQLPEKYRVPLLLRYLEGKTQEEVARQLGCPLGTVRSRLARGRSRLKEVLERRGLRLSAAGLTTALAGSAASAAAVPSLLLHATGRAALQYAAGKAAAAVVSARVAVLIKGGLKAMVAAKLKVATAVVLVTGTLVVGAGALARHVLAGLPQTTAQARSPAAPSSEGPHIRSVAHPGQNEESLTGSGGTASQESGHVVTVRGRVVTPDGKAVANATIYRCQVRFPSLKMAETKVATTGPDGRFEVESSDEGLLVAAADGFAPDCSLPEQQADELTFTLAKEIPVRGRLLDLQGKPVPKANVRVLAVRAPADGNLQGAYNAFRLNPEWTWQALPKQVPGGLAGIPAGTKTDDDGRFELKGLGQGRVVELRFEADGIEAAKVHVFTVPDFDRKAVTPTATEKKMSRFLPDYKPAVYGPTFTHAAGPCQVVQGAVTDAATGKPVAGVKIVGTAGPTYFSGEPDWSNPVEATTDAVGRFRLSGLPKARQRFLHAQAGDNPYLDQLVEVKDVAGLAPIAVAIKLHRCVMVEGRLTNKATGKPVKGQAHYMPLAENSELKSLPDTGLYQEDRLFSAPPTGTWAFTEDDGRFRLRVLRGPGVILARADDNGRPAARYTAARAAVGDRKYLLQPPKPGSGVMEIGPKSRADEEVFNTGNTTQPLRWENGYAVINPGTRDESVICAIQFDPGRTVSGKVVGPDGKPVVGAKAVGVQSTDEMRPTTFRTDTFTAYALDSTRPRELFFLHQGRKLVGMRTLRADEKDTPVVKLLPWAAVTGRVLNADGTPAAGVQISFQMSDSETDEAVRQKLHRGSRPVETDTNGRFLLEGLFPGCGVTIFASKPGYRAGILSFQPPLIPIAGEVKDLGETRFADLKTGDDAP
jgi:RNA polymerase sigma factor (sigma-70 family)